MKLYEMLDKTLYYGNVLIYTRNGCDQCIKLFQGKVQDARTDSFVWDYLLQPVDQWICGNCCLLIYVEDHHYEDRLEQHYMHSDEWTRENRPYKYSIEVEKELKSLKLEDVK